MKSTTIWNRSRYRSSYPSNWTLHSAEALSWCMKWQDSLHARKCHCIWKARNQHAAALLIGPLQCFKSQTTAIVEALHGAIVTYDIIDYLQARATRYKILIEILAFLVLQALCRLEGLALADKLSQTTLNTIYLSCRTAALLLQERGRLILLSPFVETAAILLLLLQLEGLHFLL